MSIPSLIMPNLVVPLDEGAGDRAEGWSADHPVRLAFGGISTTLEAPTSEQAGCLR